MEKITVDFEGYRAYNPIMGNIFIVDEDKDDVVIIRRHKMSKSTVYPNKEFYLKMIEDGRTNKRNR